MRNSTDRNTTPAGGTGVLAAWALGSTELMSAVLLVVWLMTWPTIFGWYYPLLSTGGSERDANTIVKWLDSDEALARLNAKLNDGVLSPKELNHYADVRQVFRQVRISLGISILIMGTLLITARGRSAVILAAQWRGLCALAILICSVSALAWWDWNVLFAWLHRPFFGALSWKLSNSAYSLRLFPAVFWQSCASAALVLPAILLTLIGWTVQRRSRSFARSGSSERRRKDRGVAVMGAIGHS